MKQPDDDNSTLLRRWRKWHVEQLELALDGDSGTIVKNIMTIARGLTPQRMPELLRLMREVDWRLVDANTKFTLLHELNAAITELREREGKPPFADALPFSDESPTLFQTVRDMLSCTSRETPAGKPANQRS